MIKTCTKVCVLVTFAVSIFSRHAQAQATINVNVNGPGHEVSPMLWGVFFEDINLSADGGLYPELVRNRSFEDASQPEFWTFKDSDNSGSTATIDKAQPLNASNPHYLSIKANGAFSLQNPGYWGMNVIQGEKYKLKLAARSRDGFDHPLSVRILSATGNELASGEIPAPTDTWQYYELELTASSSDPKASLEITSSGHGQLCLDMVSLMPETTWKGHGLRVDLGESLDALHPAFMRFPGGNWVEGDDIAHMYHWKYTIGDIDSRIPLWNTWGYNTTQGLGFEEYLQLCEDLGAEPVFDINCGMALNGISVPMDKMTPWINDALDAIEYANGPTNSQWGSLRAKAGHPAPFNLKYMEIGNENGGPAYHQRWPLMVNAIRAKYPYIKFIMTTSLTGYPYPTDPKPDIIDEHYYESPESFMRRAHQYDHYDRKGPKIFIGEYAVTENSGFGNLRAALGEAAFMTGMERNSDVVAMASYAPLFVNMNHRAWNPDLINFDSSRWYGLPSYYVQQMFSLNRGDATVPVEVNSPRREIETSKGKIGVGTWNTEAEFKDIKVTSPDGKTLFASDFSTNLDGWEQLGGGHWEIADGTMRQNAEKEFIRALAGSPSWMDYTLTLKARKLGGREGFLILFHIINDEDRVWWNLGGWQNTQDALENGGVIDPKPGYIGENHWYDIRVEVSGKHVKCYLDGQLVHDINYESEQRVAALYSSATRDEKTGDLIVKAVNVSAGPLKTQINLFGAKNLTGQGAAIVLTSANASDENTLDNPTRVVPANEAFNFTGDSLTRVLPGNSFTVFRFRTK